MLARVYSCAVIGLDGALVKVEVDIAPGLPAFNVVGLGDIAVHEARERVRSAIRNSGASFVMQRITVNLAPADLRKAGPAYDLPIAIGLLLASGQLEADVAGAVFIGELGLDGSLRHTEGILPMVAIAQRAGMETVYVPFEDAPEAALVEHITVVPVRTIAELAAHLAHERPIRAYLGTQRSEEEPEYTTDFADVRGQEHARRALEVAAAGGHNVLLTGSPGSGKTLMARALPSILPPMTGDEALEVTKIYSVGGKLPAGTPLLRRRPFRAPHHTISYAALVGGGKTPRPGEVSLAHRGVLFLDELPEFPLQALEALRQPLEDRMVTIGRSAGTLMFPANFILVAARNPCRCGWHADVERLCSCTAAEVTRYGRRVSGPLLDRIDLHVEVARVAYEKLASERQDEASAAIRERVLAARERQAYRLRGSGLLTNADLRVAEVRVWCRADAAAQSLLRAAMRQLELSARGYHRVLKLARTIADLAGSELITAAHVAEALQYRPRRAE